MKTMKYALLFTFLLAAYWSWTSATDRYHEQDHDQHDHVEEHGSKPVPVPRLNRENGIETPGGKKPVTRHTEENHPGIPGELRHGEDTMVRLTHMQQQNAGLEVRKVTPGVLQHRLELPGEIVFNRDRLTRLAPRVPGIVREVYKTVGDQVKAGEVLAVIDSRELADARSEYLTSRSGLELLQIRFERESELRDKKISSEQDFLDARRAFLEARINFRRTRQKLLSLGLTSSELESLVNDGDTVITRYKLKAPFPGKVIARNVAPGESVSEETVIFTIADFDRLWANLFAGTNDLALLEPGQKVILTPERDTTTVTGRIRFITPFLERSTRTATVRVLLDNSADRFRPGVFITGTVVVRERPAPLLVTREAVVLIDGKETVFVRHDDSFTMENVVTGERDDRHVEILAGLAENEEYVARGAFHLKAAYVTSNLDPHAGHGH